jgi:hypothetical protein
MTSVLRVIGNSASFLASIVLAAWFLKTNPLISAFFILSAIDNYEDVYEIVTRKHLVPQYLVPADIVFEAVMLLFGLYVTMLGYTYIVYFETPFALMLLASGISITFSSTKDIIKNIQRLRGVEYAIPALKVRAFRSKYVKLVKKN